MDIERSYIDVRQFGPNRGIPTLHLEINDNRKPTADLLKDILDIDEMPDWVFIKGENVQGLGAYLKGLVEFNLSIELYLKTTDKGPSWINSVDNVLIDYNNDSDFNYFLLRQNKDFLIFKAETEEDVKNLYPIYKELNLLPCTKWLLVSEKVYWSAFELTTKFKRCRMSLKEPNNHVRVHTNQVQVRA